MVGKREEIDGRRFGVLAGVRAGLLRASFGLGAICLLVAMAADFAGVVARHLGLTLLGVIEVIQLCIVGIISAALVTATVTGSHAAVHLLTSRLTQPWRGRVERTCELVAGVLFLVLAVGDGWILVDLWPRHEQSDLLHLPYAPARALWCASLAISGVLALAAVLSPIRPVARPAGGLEHDA